MDLIQHFNIENLVCDLDVKSEHEWGWYRMKFKPKFFKPKINKIQLRIRHIEITKPLTKKKKTYLKMSKSVALTTRSQACVETVQIECGTNKLN